MCGKIFYLQLKLGAGAIIKVEGKLLLLKRNHEPFLGSWNLPAGYVNANESPRHAVQREVEEECGFKVDVGVLVDAYFFDDDPRGNGVILIYQCAIVGGELRLNDEVTEASYFPPFSLPTSLAGGGHDQAILSWKKANN